MLTDWFYVINIFSYCCRKLCEMPGNTLKLSGKVREKSVNFIFLPNLWEPWLMTRNWRIRKVRPTRVIFGYCSSHGYFTRFSAQNSLWSSQVSKGLCLVDAKTANARSASHTNDDISQQPAALQDGERSTAGEDRTGDETWVHCYQPESEQASKQSKHKESPSPTKFKVLLLARKVMAIMFFGGTWKEFCLLSFRNRVEV